MTPQRGTGKALVSAIISGAISSGLFGIYLATVETTSRYSSNDGSSGYLVFAWLTAVISIAALCYAAYNIGETIDYKHDLLVDEYQQRVSATESDNDAQDNVLG